MPGFEATVQVPVNAMPIRVISPRIKQLQRTMHRLDGAIWPRNFQDFVGSGVGLLVDHESEVVRPWSKICSDRPNAVGVLLKEERLFMPLCEIAHERDE